MSKGVRITTSRIMDLLNLLIGLVAGNNQAMWQEGLSPAATSSLAKLRRDYGSEGILSVRKAVSAIPGWEAGSFTELSDQLSGQIDQALWNLLQGAANELEQLGYAEYWQEQLQPVLHRALFRAEAVVSEVALDNELFGLGLTGLDNEQDIVVCICSQGEATPARLAGNIVLVDMSLPPAKLLSSAIYELCDNPLDFARVEPQLHWLMKDPLFQKSYNDDSAEFAWWTKRDYLLENVRVALSLLVAERLGLLANAGRQLAQFNQSSDGLTYEMAVVLLGYLKQLPQLPDEDVTGWFGRVVLMMNLGNLQADYSEQARRLETCVGGRSFEGPRRTCLVDVQHIAAAAE